MENEKKLLPKCTCGHPQSKHLYGGYGGCNEFKCVCDSFVLPALENLDWENALEHFESIRSQYRELLGMPGLNTELALAFVFRPLATRYERGERTAELYFEMMSVE